MLPDPLVDEVSLVDVVEPARNLERRLHEGRTAPVRIAFFGPTGVGKSKVFNSILRGVLSPSGYRRPFTRQAVYFVHQDLHSNPATVGLEGMVQSHDREEWRDRILVDTPDFDGVEDINRQIAERIYLEADVLVFVTDTQKYADAGDVELYLSP